MYRLNLKLVLISILTLCLFSCDNKQTGTPEYNATATNVKEFTGINPTGTTASAFEYIKHVDGKKPTIKEGEYAYFRYYIKKRDSILMSSADQGIGRMKIPSQEEITKQPQASPVLEGLLKMGVGDSLSVYFPVSKLPRAVPEFENEPFIIYSMFLESIKDEATYQADMEEEKKKLEAEMALVRAKEEEVGTMVKATAADYGKGKLDGQIKTTASGLKYIIHEQGTGAKAENGKTVMVQYYGSLTNGTMFDNSFKRGQSFNFPLGQGRVIKGWDEGIALLNVGSKATFFIPADLGYGAAGSPPVIPANAELIFYVELEEVL